MKLHFYLIKFILQKGCTMCQVQSDIASGSLCQVFSSLSAFLHCPLSCHESRVMRLVSYETEMACTKIPKRGISALPMRALMKAMQ